MEKINVDVLSRTTEIPQWPSFKFVEQPELLGRLKIIPA